MAETLEAVFKNGQFVLKWLPETNIIDLSEGSIIITGHNSDFFNILVLQNDCGNNENIIAKARTLFQGLRLNASCTVRVTGASLETIHQLEENGFRKSETLIGMSKETALFSADATKVWNGSIQTVKDDDWAKDWVRTVSTAFPFSKLSAKAMRHVVPELIAHTHDVSFFAAIENRRVVGTASAFAHGRTMGLTNLAVLPSYRRRGIAACLVRYALEAGKKQGAALSVVQAAQTAMAFWQKLRFRPCAEFARYVFSP